MLAGKCGKGMGLCPFSFGLALGLACGIAVFVWAGWVAMFGMPDSMAGHMLPPTTLVAVAMKAGMCVVKGFLFGFIVALLYDFITCCMAKCCNKSNGNGGCGCGSAACSCCNKPKA